MFCTFESFAAAFDTYPSVSRGHNIISFYGLGFGTVSLMLTPDTVRNTLHTMNKT